MELPHEGGRDSQDVLPARRWSSWAVAGLSAAGPSFVDITWMSISNMYYELGPAEHRDRRLHHAPAAERVLRRRRRSVRRRDRPFKPDVAAVTRVLNALGGPLEREPAADRPQPFRSFVRHGHLVEADRRAHHRIEDDLPAGAGREAFPRIAAGRVYGGEAIRAGRRRDDEGRAMESQRRSGGESGAAQPRRADAVPVPDPATGGLRAGVAEDFPNGGGNRAFLFTVDGPQGASAGSFRTRRAPSICMCRSSLTASTTARRSRI